MNPLTLTQLENNRQHRDHWAAFAHHRRMTTALLKIAGHQSSLASSMNAETKAKPRLCLLGAGNCNDVNLQSLLESFREIHLVDLDPAALEFGVNHQGQQHSPAIHRHAAVDVTGIANEMAAWSSERILTAPKLAHICTATELARAALPGPFDVVASCGLLSQLVHAVVASATERHPQFIAIVQAVRLGHFELLARLTAPGGRCVLITDVVSSLTVPALETCADADLPELLPQLVRDQNFFHGMNPVILADIWQTNPQLLATTRLLSPVSCWKWNLGPRQYLIWASLIERLPTDWAETPSVSTTRDQ